MHTILEQKKKFISFALSVVVIFSFIALIAYAQCDPSGRPRNAYLQYQVASSSSSGVSDTTVTTSSSSSSSSGAVNTGACCIGAGSSAAYCTNDVSIYGPCSGTFYTGKTCSDPAVSCTPNPDQFNCNGSNPTQAAWDYINTHCPNVFKSVPPYETVPPPNVQFVPYINGGSNDVCGYTYCADGIIKIRACNLTGSNLPGVCSNLTLAGCPDICHTAAHEFGHWVWCKTGGFVAKNTCQEWYIEIGAERHSYDTCLSKPYLADPTCSITAEYLKCACDLFYNTTNNCQNNSTLTAEQKEQVKKWCTITPPPPPPEQPCDCATEYGARRCVAGEPGRFERCSRTFVEGVCTWAKFYCTGGTTCSNGECI